MLIASRPEDHVLKITIELESKKILLFLKIKMM